MRRFVAEAFGPLAEDCFVGPTSELTLTIRGEQGSELLRTTLDHPHYRGAPIELLRFASVPGEGFLVRQVRPELALRVIPGCRMFAMIGSGYVTGQMYMFEEIAGRRLSWQEYLLSLEQLLYALERAVGATGVGVVYARTLDIRDNARHTARYADPATLRSVPVQTFEEREFQRLIERCDEYLIR